MRLFAQILLVLVFASLLPLEVQSLENNLLSTIEWGQKSNTVGDNHPKVPNLFVPHPRHEYGALITNRQFESVPVNDSEREYPKSNSQFSVRKIAVDYLKRSQIFEISLSINALIFPFHFHF